MTARCSSDAISLRRAYGLVFGLRGTAAVATLIALAAGGARFAAERRLHALLRERGIGGWDANLPVMLDGYGTAVLDVAFRGRRVVAEVDGWAYHRDIEAFRRDPRRQNEVAIAGWVVLRVTWHDLMADPGGVIAAIEAALRGDRSERSFRLAG